eukprot:gb/GFBE01075653.1/.p1 GENE.gb/GFBE01075653.1/~~gb/GFBE01075653.1/.p1  ORF type:complete len:283 (+),score=59.22 gb/GFBE01075653.1/:1-849(+)
MGGPSAPMQHVEGFGLVCWILKDAMWVIRLPFMAWTALFASLCFELAVLTQQWRSGSWFWRAHRAVIFLWLAGNGVWMTSELLFEDPEKGGKFYWFQESVVGHREGPIAASYHYDMGLLVARVLYGLALVAYACLHYAAKLKSKIPGVSEDSDPALAELYSDAWIGPWILKDVAWTFSLFRSGVVCCFLASFIMVRSCLRSGDVVFLVELLWLTGNLVWFFGEVKLDDVAQWPRFAALMLFAAAGVLQVRTMTSSREQAKSEGFEEIREPRPSFRSLLFPKT